MNVHALRSRWRTPDGEKLSEEIFVRLVGGRPLDDLEVGWHDGRLDLRGISAPTPARLRRYEKYGLFLEELGGLIFLRDYTLEGLDFSAAILDRFRLFTCSIRDCRFEEARCQDWRLWGVEVEGTTFAGADLRSAVLGPWYEGRGNSYRSVTFARADMRDISSEAAAYVDCDFSHASLSNVDFGSSSFIRCKFAGELREVIFNDHGFETGKPDPNPMCDADLSDATLRWVEFRNLALTRVRLPTDTDHVVINEYPCVLREALARLSRGDEPDLVFISGLLENQLCWIGPRTFGILNRKDLEEFVDGETAQRAISFLKELEAVCAAERRRPFRRLRLHPSRTVR